MKKLIVALMLFSASAATAQDPSIADYFQGLCRQYAIQFALRDDGTFDSFCNQFELSKGDSNNLRNYYTISILHQLFTTVTCSDGSRGAILNMPYFWHYRSPNPRHAIRVNGKINTAYTGIERTPHFFLGDMIAPTEKFTHPEFGTFPSFGWCSEREMAFACLLSVMGFTTHVIAPGNHAVTEVEVPFRGTGGYAKTFVITVDNTFNYLTFSPDAPSDHHNIYDRRGLAVAEVALVKALKVSAPARDRIGKACSGYLNIP